MKWGNSRLFPKCTWTDYVDSRWKCIWHSTLTSTCYQCHCVVGRAILLVPFPLASPVRRIGQSSGCLLSTMNSSFHLGTSSQPQLPNVNGYSLKQPGFPMTSPDMALTRKTANCIPLATEHWFFLFRPLAKNQQQMWQVWLGISQQGSQ